jgi:hypothetical protein
MPSLTRKVPDLLNRGSLITYADADGNERCLGDLFHSAEHGTYDPTLGLVDVTKADAETHNKLLDAARLEGLDERCGVGQRGYAYLSKDEATGEHQITTFSGTVVTKDVTVNGKIVTFRRKGKVLRGRLQEGGCLNFRRIE